MSGVWDHRLVNRDVYAVRCDRVERFVVSMTDESHPGVMIRRIVATAARFHGGKVHPDSAIDEAVTR